MFNSTRETAIQDGYTALVLAGKNDHISCVKILLKAGADLTAFDKVLGGALSQALIDDEGNNMWPEFLKFLFELASSANPDMKEAALRMFGAVPAVFGNQVRKLFLRIQG